MKKIMLCIFLVIIAMSAHAEKRAYKDEAIIQVSINGKITKEKPGYINYFDIKKDKIYQKSIAIRDVGGVKKGETWEDKTPYIVIGEGFTLPYDPPFLEKLLGPAKIRSQKVICAVRMNRGLIGTSATNLILGEDFSFEYRPVVGFGGITIFTGKRIE